MELKHLFFASSLLMFYFGNLFYEGVFICLLTRKTGIFDEVRSMWKIWIFEIILICVFAVDAAGRQAKALSNRNFI